MRTQAIPTSDPNGIARKREARMITGLSDTTMWRLEKAGKFPKRVQISTGAVGYIRGELYDWVAARPGAR